MSTCEALQWKGRAGMRLANGVIELTVLNGGGHLAALHFLGSEDGASQNVLWEAPWETGDPGQERTQDLAALYGTPGVGRFLAGYTGHSLCLDAFGEPTPEEAAAGLTLHGEAPVETWNAIPLEGGKAARCRWSVRLPIAHLDFEREIRLGEGESVVFVEETVRNLRAAEHRFDWVQHVTLGPPFLQPDESTVLISARQGISWPLGYEGGSLLSDNQQFSWPNAPRSDGKGTVDLTRPFAVRGRGFIAAAQLDPRRQVEYVWAANPKIGLSAGYCFRRNDFPWITIWEENCARQDPPWSGRTMARGLEFGTTAMPLGRQENLRRGAVLDTPSGCVLPAKAQRTARYLIFLAAMPTGGEAVQEITLGEDAILLRDANGKIVSSIPAKGCEAFLATDN